MRVKLEPGATLPTRVTGGAAGYDLYAHIPVTNELPDELPTVEVKKAYIEQEITTISTGVSVEIPAGYVGLVFLRSSAGKRGLRLANGTGVIDSDYRGEIKLALEARFHPIPVSDGERIAQLVITPILTPELKIVDALDETERGAGGFGSTGR